jgi:hypothetical protein
MATVILAFSYSGALALGDTHINGSITLTGENSGTITSVGGASVTAKLAGFNLSGKVGNANDTQTNINSIFIAPGSNINKPISLDGHNSGTITNVGSKVNINTIKVGY